ncbi:MAG TPA: ATP-binding protein [Candidatus Kapabacteria bacterium]|nr:ATP-binding protein [Candidatus Kapabacteria bacterium]
MGSLRRRAFIFPLLYVAAALATACCILAATGSLQQNFIWASAAIIIIGAIFFWMQAKSLVHPIADLVPQAAEIAKGRLEVTNHGKDEIPEELRSLADAINQIGEKQGRDYAAMQKLERVRSEFLANVSHELRTPIFAVQGFLETLLDGAVDDPSVNRDFLSRAHTQSERLNALLSDLIDISRIESGEMRMSFRIFDIQPFLRDLVAEMSGIAEQKQIELFFFGNVPTDNEVEVFGDKERLKQVMVNLIDNAIKYTELGGIVKVELFDHTPTHSNVQIVVRDSGIGIEPEHLPRLFERFYRVDKDRSRLSPGGTGLGLAICKHIIEAHRGQITVESEPGKGSAFSVTLPKEPERSF